MRSLRSRLKISEVGLPIGPSARGMGGRDRSWVTPVEASGAVENPGAP